MPKQPVIVPWFRRSDYNLIKEAIKTDGDVPNPMMNGSISRRSILRNRRRAASSSRRLSSIRTSSPASARLPA